MDWLKIAQWFTILGYSGSYGDIVIRNGECWIKLFEIESKLVTVAIFYGLLFWTCEH